MDLYIRSGHKLLDDNDPEVIELSRVLNALPLAREGSSTFRNPNGVAMKLGNLRHLDPTMPGGLPGGGKRIEPQVWERYFARQDELHAAATRLRAVAAGDAPAPNAPVPGEDEAEEGRILYRVHRTRERRRDLVSRKKEEALATTGALGCEVCGLDALARYGSEVGREVIEAHHTIPLASVKGTRMTRIADLALVCANCHAAIHAGGRTRSLDEVRRMVT